MAPAPYHPYSHHPDQGPYVVFPNHADQILSNCIHILGVSLITFCLARRTEHEQLLTRQGWLNLTWTRFCCLILFLDSWFFLAFSGILINGVGLSYSLPVCSLGIYSCITFYALSKFIIYGFLTERVWIVWSAGKSTRRIHSQTYKVCASIIIAYSFIFVLLIVGRIYDIRSSDGSCEIGLRFFASIPLVTFDLIVNILLTALFIWPLYRDNINNSRLRNVALRTLIAAGVALTTSSVNIAILAGLGGRQLGWVCLGSCSTDVTVNALVIYWVTAPAYRDHDVSNHNVNANNAANQNGNYDNDYHGQSIPSLRVPLTLLSIGAVLSEGPGMSPTVASPITPVTPVERDDDDDRGQGQSGDKNKKGKWFGFGFGSGWRVGRSEDDDMLPRPVVAVYSKRKHTRENGWWRNWIVRGKTNEAAARGLPLPSPLTPVGVDVSSGQGRVERAGEGDGGDGGVVSERHSHPPGLIVCTDELEKGDMSESGTPRLGEDEEEEDEKAGFVLLVDSSSESKECEEAEAGSSESSLPLRRVMTVPTPTPMSMLMPITRTISMSRTPSLTGSIFSRSRSYLGFDDENGKEEEDRGEGSSSGITASARRRLGGGTNDCRVGSETSPLKRKRGERRSTSSAAATPAHGLHEQEEARRLTVQIPGSSLTRALSRTSSSSSSSASAKAPRVMRSQSWDDELVNGWTRSQSRSQSRTQSRNSQLEDTFGTVNGPGNGRRALTVMVEHEVMRFGVEVLQPGPGWSLPVDTEAKSKQMVHPEHDNNDTETETGNQVDFVHTKPPNQKSKLNPNPVPRPISRQQRERERQRPSFPVRSYSYNNASSNSSSGLNPRLGLGSRGGGGDSGVVLGLGAGTQMQMQTQMSDQVHSRSLSVPLARLWIPPDGDGRGQGQGRGS